jgi:hypothetical protein
MTRNSIESPTATPYLPTEVVRQIFSNSTPRVIINARKSCRQLRDVIDGDRNLDSCIQIVKEMTSMTAAVYKVPTPVGAIFASRVNFQSCQLRFTSIYKIDARHIFLMQGSRYENVRDRPLFNRDLQTMLKDDLMKYYNCNSFLTHVRACGILEPKKNCFP